MPEPDGAGTIDMSDDPWKRWVWVVLENSTADSVWTDEADAKRRAAELEAEVDDTIAGLTFWVRVAKVELDPSTSGGLQIEIDLWARGGRGKRPGLAADQG